MIQPFEGSGAGAPAGCGAEPREANLSKFERFVGQNRHIFDPECTNMRSLTHSLLVLSLLLQDYLAYSTAQMSQACWLGAITAYSTSHHQQLDRMSSSTARAIVNSVGGFGGGGALTTAARRPERRTCSSCGGGGVVGVIVKLTERSSVALMTKPPPSGGVHSSPNPSHGPGQVLGRARRNGEGASRGNLLLFLSSSRAFQRRVNRFKTPTGRLNQHILGDPPPPDPDFSPGCARTQCRQPSPPRGPPAVASSKKSLRDYSFLVRFFVYF